MATDQNSRSGTYILFLTQGLEIDLILALRAAVTKILADFQNFHIWAGIPTLSFYSHSLTSLSTQRIEIELIFALWAAVFETRTNFQNCHIWA